jgi:hypothetical protein
MKDEYYDLRGWDKATGIPTRETLEKYGLHAVVADLEKRAILALEVKANPGKQSEAVKK